LSEEPPRMAAAGLIDLHCHILPGRDDGARTLDMAVAMARNAEADGVGTIVATPHVFRDGRTLEDPGAIGRDCDALNRSLEAAGIRVEILPGAEVHVSHDLISEIRAHRNSLVLNKSPYLCVEFPEDVVFPGTRDLFFDLLNDGITPIIAHPERNSAFRRNPGLLRDLVQMGSLSQANAGSLSGRFGSRALEAVGDFLKSNLVHFLASDAHDEMNAESWLSSAAHRAEPFVGRERAMALVRDNPLVVISGKPFPDWPAPLLSRGEQKPFKFRISNILRRRG
jgi:protein-tyrosine phosphatase